MASASVSAVTVYNATLEFFRGDVLISSGCLASIEMLENDEQRQPLIARAFFYIDRLTTVSE